MGARAGTATTCSRSRMLPVSLNAAPARSVARIFPAGWWPTGTGTVVASGFVTAISAPGCWRSWSHHDLSRLPPSSYHGSTSRDRGRARTPGTWSCSPRCGGDARGVHAPPRAPSPLGAVPAPGTRERSRPAEPAMASPNSRPLPRLSTHRGDGQPRGTREGRDDRSAAPEAGATSARQRRARVRACGAAPRAGGLAVPRGA
jgi:hypothetical protein